MNTDKDDWKTTDINVDSLWIIPSRDKGGKHANVYHGNFIPQIPNQLIRRYTQRLVTKYELGLAHEMHLQQYIVQHIGNLKSLDECLGINNEEIEWLGNEVACGVGMQRIDIMVSIKKTDIKRVLFPIELKSVEIQKDTVNQLDRYIDWIEQYYISNLQSTIQPVLICKDNKQTSVTQDVKNSFDAFNKRGQVRGVQRYLPLIFIQYTASSSPNFNIVFNKINY